MKAERKLRTTWPDKYCEYCGKQLIRSMYSTDKKEQKSNFLKRKFCNPICQKKSYRATFDIKYCLYCKKELKRREDEISVAYRARQFCNHDCYSKHLMKDDPSDSQWYRRLREIREKDSCIVCGVTEKLHNHHVDKNIRNNKENNLMTLCGSCHIIFHGIVRKIERQNVKS